MTKHMYLKHYRYSNTNLFFDFNLSNPKKRKEKKRKEKKRRGVCVFFWVSPVLSRWGRYLWGHVVSESWGRRSAFWFAETPAWCSGRRWSWAGSGTGHLHWDGHWSKTCGSIDSQTGKHWHVRAELNWDTVPGWTLKMLFNFSKRQMVKNLLQWSQKDDKCKQTGGRKRMSSGNLFGNHMVKCCLWHLKILKTLAYTEKSKLWIMDCQ